jgi:uncharacterized phage-like protein YoqJ
MLTLEDLNISETCTASGHRPTKLGGYNSQSPFNLKLKAALQTKLQQAYNLGYRKFISGFAIGWDTFFSEAVLLLKETYPDVHLVAFIPFEESINAKGELESQYSKWPKSSQDLYHKLLEECSLVHYVSGPGYGPWKMDVRNKAMANYSSRALTCWDGSEGGTGNFMNYVNGLTTIEIDNINPNDLRGR